MRLKSFEKLKYVSGGSTLKIAIPEKSQKIFNCLEQTITLKIN